MSELSSKMGSKEEIEKNFEKIMNEIQAKCETEYKKALGNKSYEQYESEYNAACKKVIGTKDYKETAKNFVENAKTQAAYTETGLTIAASLLLPGSSVVRGGLQKAAVKYGEKTAAQGFKAAMTFGMGSAPTILTTLNAATSEEGFTPEKIAEIKEKFKNGMLYGGLGAYASGPLGNAVEKVLSKNPAALTNAVSKAFNPVGITGAQIAGGAAETSCDILFDLITSETGMKDSLEQNGIMNLGMMIAGGRISKGINNNLKELKVSKNTDGTFSVKDTKGVEVFKAKDENDLSGFVLGKGLETNPEAASKEKANTETPVTKPLKKELSVETINKIEEFGFDDDLKKQLTEILESSDDESYSNVFAFIKRKQQPVGGDVTEDYTNTLIIEMLKKCQNTDGKIHEKALKYMSDNTKGGYDKFTQARIDRLDMAKNPDGSINEKGIDLLLLSKYLKNNDRNQLFSLIKESNGNFNEKLLDMALKIDGESGDCSDLLSLFDNIKNEDSSINPEKYETVKKLTDSGNSYYMINRYFEMSKINGQTDMKFLNNELIPKINELTEKGYSLSDILNNLEKTKDLNGNIRPNTVDGVFKAASETPEGKIADIRRTINLRAKENPNNNQGLALLQNAQSLAQRGDKTIMNELAELLHIEGREPQLTDREIHGLIFIPRRAGEKINIGILIESGLLKNIDGRKTPLNVKELAELSKLDKDVLSKIADRGILNDIPGRENNLTINEAKRLAKINDNAWQNVCDRNLLTTKVKEGFLTTNDIIDLAFIDSDSYKNIKDKNLLDICSSKENINLYHRMVDVDTLKTLANLNENDWSKLRDLGVFDENTNQLKVKAQTLNGFSKLTPEQAKRVKEYNLLKGLDTPEKIKTQSFQTLWLARSNNETWQNVIDNNLLSAKINDGTTMRNLTPDEMCHYSALNKEEWNNVLSRNLTGLKLNDKNLSTESIINFSRIDNERWNNIEKRDLFNKEISERDIIHADGSSAMHFDLKALRSGVPLGKLPRKLAADEILFLAELNDTQYKQAEGLFDIPGRVSQLGIRDIATLAKEESSVLNRIRDRGLLTSGFNNGSEIVRLGNLENEHWNRAQNLIQHTKGRYSKLQADDIITLSKMSDESWKNLQERNLLNVDNGNLDKDGLIAYSALDASSWKNISERSLFEFTNDYNGENRSQLIAGLSEIPDSMFFKLREQKAVIQRNKDIYGELDYYDLVDCVVNPEKAVKEHISKRIEVLSYLSKLDENARLDFENAGIKVGDIELMLSSSLGNRRDVINTPQKFDFLKEVISNNNPKNERIIKEFDFAQFGEDGIPLKYSRKAFVHDINELIKDLPLDEQHKVLNYFGMTKTDNGIEGILNNKEIDRSKFSDETAETAEKIRNKIEEFTFKNESDDAGINDSEIKELLDGLIKGMPEFTSIIGKKQHGTHAYSVDIHTLKVLQTAMNNPKFQQLSDQDKTILKMSVLLHDLGKKEAVVDHGHATLSSDYTMSILEKFKLPSTVKDRIVDIVDNHHWFESYNRGLSTAEQVATRCRRPQDFKISEIFAEADFANVNKTFHYENTNTRNAQEFDAFMTAKMQPIQDALQKLYSKSNIVLDTQFTQANQKFPTVDVNINGKSSELRVLNLTDEKLNGDLFKYGFAPGTTKESARFTVHMVENTNMSTKMGSVEALLKNPTNQSTWSTSLISLKNSRTYTNRKFGFVLDVDQANISEANYANTGSGCEKTINKFSEILFNGDNSARTYVRDHLLSELKLKGVELTDVEYADLAEYLHHKKYTTQIKDFTVGNKTIKRADLVEALENSRDKLFEGGDIHSEIVSINPRVKGLVARVTDISECPPEFLNFAKQHNLPIILIGFNGQT